MCMRWPSQSGPLLGLHVPVGWPLRHLAPMHLGLPCYKNCHFRLCRKCLLQAFLFPLLKLLIESRTVNVVEFTLPDPDSPPFSGVASCPQLSLLQALGCKQATPAAPTEPFSGFGPSHHQPLLGKTKKPNLTPKKKVYKTLLSVFFFVCECLCVCVSVSTCVNMLSSLQLEIEPKTVGGYVFFNPECSTYTLQ